MKYWFTIQKERIERLWVYGKYVWKLGEWDHSWHTGLWKLSLERLYKIMDEGHAIFPEKEKRKMKTVIKLLERLSDSDLYHDDPHYIYYRKKWGEPDFDFSGNYFKDRNEEKLTNKQKEQKHKDFKRVMKHINYQRRQDIELFGRILKTDLYKWWD